MDNASFVGTLVDGDTYTMSSNIAGMGSVTSTQGSSTWPIGNVPTGITSIPVTYPGSVTSIPVTYPGYLYPQPQPPAWTLSTSPWNIPPTVTLNLDRMTLLSLLGDLHDPFVARQRLQLVLEDLLDNKSLVITGEHLLLILQTLIAVLSIQTTPVLNLPNKG